MYARKGLSHAALQNGSRFGINGYKFTILAILLPEETVKNDKITKNYMEMRSLSYVFRGASTLQYRLVNDPSNWKRLPARGLNRHI
jgi:hypothetical protein